MHHIWHAYSTDETFSNDTRVNDIDRDIYSKIANLVFVAAGGGGIRVSQTRFIVSKILVIYGFHCMVSISFE